MSHQRNLIRDAVQHQAHWLELANLTPCRLVLGHMEWAVIERAALKEGALAVDPVEPPSPDKTFAGFPVTVTGYTGIRLMVEWEARDAGL